MQTKRIDLQSLINDAVRRKSPAIDLPPGNHLCANPIVIRDIDGLVINGEKTRLVMTNPLRNGLEFYNCRNISVKGFQIDYDPLPYTQGTVAWRSADATEFQFEIHDGYPDVGFLNPLNGRRTNVFDPKTLNWKNAMDFGSKYYDDLYPVEGRAISSRRGLIKFNEPIPAYKLDVGDYVAIANRALTPPPGCVTFRSCVSVRMEDVVIMAAPCYAVECAFMDGDNYFRYQVARGPQGGYGVPRLLSTNADAFNYSQSRVGPLVERCDFSFMDDDSVNIHGNWLGVVDMEDGRAVRLAVAEHNAGCAALFAPGDGIRFFSAGNFALVAEAKIESLTELSQPEKSSPEIIKRAGWRHMNPDATVLRTFLVRLDRPVRLQPGACCDVSSAMSSGYVVRDCFFHDHRAYGLRLYAGQGLVENNRIERVKSGAITIGNWPTEGLWGAHTTLRGNRIRDVSCNKMWPGAIALSGFLDDFSLPYPQAIRNTVIENNLIKNCAASGVFINAADGVRIRGNTIRRSNQVNLEAECKPFRTWNREAIATLNSSNIDIADNVIDSK